MYLIPMPQSVKNNGNTFRIGPEFEIVLDMSCGFAEHAVARTIKEETERAVCSTVTIRKSDNICDADLMIQKVPLDSEEYQLTVLGDGVKLVGGEQGIFWGAQTLRQIIRQSGAIIPGVGIKDKPRFSDRGFMYDVTRGKVPKLDTLYELADKASFYKLNQLQLYIEHTFAFRNFSEVCMGKDPLRAEEILLLDEYCAKRHIELVPTLATFGHLYEMLTTKSFSKYAELEGSDEKPFAFYDRMAHHTLNVADDGSFGVVKSMIDEFLPLFSSGRFNICCDETFDIGKGKSASIAAEKGNGRLYVDFLKKVIGYAQQKGKRVLFWGDIILKSPEYLNEIPTNTDCLYWNYGREIPENEIKTLSESGVSFYGCPGVCGWNVMMNIIDGGYDNIKSMAGYGCKYGAKGILCTDWGDFGHVNFFANSMPGMSFGADFSWNAEDSRSFEEMARAYSVLEYGSGAQNLVCLLNDLAALQAGTWADIVCWEESQYSDSENAHKDKERLKGMDEQKALDGYHRALEIESELSAFHYENNKKQDMREFVCSARGVALMNAACLAVKKYAYGCGKLTAMENSELAVKIENWFDSYTTLWRARNRESELYRIREKFVCLCRALREWK